METQSVKDTTDEYLKKNSELFCWFEQYCMADLNASTSSEEIWNHYVKTNKTGVMLKKMTFLIKIKDVVKKEKNKDGNIIYRCSIKSKESKISSEEPEL